MREVIEQEYQEFIQGHDRIVVDGTAVKLIDGSQIELLEPKEFSLEKR